MLLPIVEYVPAVQSWHSAAAAAAENVPDAHRLQLLAAGAPEPVKKEPAEQFRHMVAAEEVE